MYIASFIDIYALRDDQFYHTPKLIIENRFNNCHYIVHIYSIVFPKPDESSSGFRVFVTINTLNITLLTDKVFNSIKHYFMCLTRNK